MTTLSTITRLDYENYLIQVYFGTDKDLLKACIKRAYRDFNRTLHGFGEFENANEIYTQAVDLLKNSFDNLKPISKSEVTAEIFDSWHKITCERLISLFISHGYPFFVGQAQKWVNMTLKYIFTVGEQRISGFGPVYPYCHVPFDNILLEQLKNYGFPMLNCAWSRLKNYDEYLEKQKWIREKFSILPMDVEFRLWAKQEIQEIEP